MATKWGVVSAGKISHDFVTAVRSMQSNEHEFVAIAARNLDSAKEFASRHGISKAYGSYEELAKDPDVEVVYVGTIFPYHFPVGKLMLENGKHVLMEKAMCLNSKQTKTLVDIARKNGRFLMEAIWSRFFPVYKTLKDLLQKGTIGDIVHVDVTFGKPLLHAERLVKKSMGGGTVLDLGIYVLNAVNFVYNGEKPSKIVAVGHLNDEGVDIGMASSMQFSNNRTANVATTATAEMPNELVITGKKGHIKVLSPMWCPTVIQTPNEVLEFPLPDTIAPCNFENSSGLRFEAMEVRKCIQKGELESSIMPLKDSITLSEMIDEIHRQIGVSYPDD
ncbi:trans-1,2-dihydrobenzene-1,2-diol dehydrogenase-like [Uloborus diversus]|uniref:trans-1,2-dihydrobenzene-1,2-diol dehydrogenase-like n=1 Tax=Uloborus diversus TaxID=327109 RepID=UPI002409C1E0|nr:trans-1,2-dihydrobenzene-1,2-diol dehydrogenase-like [Uloborus diversus]XP_054714005.1 trans-1,2-dihydrobenzene-1,2-diol dehydrogenase-like [Uloborus diversus]XP_054714006.1 trans-1,2-dihydrobenzene-1,2-diol dehydrogenase-like [Uloborus diversus]XP_054714007.1 trans-1,2-dihydrobenzene-1,2-diol dehydrogenase-like [Uloborus diversus]XP_054714008.1 trans-1,2-dihydrobenzene-1,2-diol dehydrogenase-like [Uloborus diversus]XP_054714009.1 trans-1,2-dihydrobenzene-1,2-diol dehydrogenase-like [Ulobor